MRMRMVAIVAVGVGFLTLGCVGKGFRDYCDKCQDDYTEDGCKAAAKAEAKYAKALKCGKEFRKVDKCLKDVSACEDVASCESEWTDYSKCTCKAESEDTSICN